MKFYAYESLGWVDDYFGVKSKKKIQIPFFKFIWLWILDYRVLIVK